VNRLTTIFTRPRNLLVFLHDTAMTFFAVLAAFYLRLGDAAFDQVETILQLAAVYAGTASIVFVFTGLYRHAWFYVSFSDCINIAKSATYATLVFLPVVFLLTRLEDVPRSVPVIAWFVALAFLAAPRLLYRMVRGKTFALTARNRHERSPVLVIGAGDEAAHFVRATQFNSGNPFRVVGLVTATPERVGQMIHGVEVIGLERDLEHLVMHKAAQNDSPLRLIVARPDVRGETLRRFMDVAQATGCALSRLPPATDVQTYGEADIAPRPIELEDLLGRPRRSLDRAAMRSLIEGRRVLVTGAGGSIGTELVRQIAAAGPEHLTLLDNGEFNLYTIDQELGQRWPQVSSRAVLADVRDRDRVHTLFAEEAPDIVFHAAALKHVPLVEYNPLEGLATNALGTRHVADACLAHGVAEMVLLSTDKAVNPANVMGAGKRLAELYCQAADLEQSGTRFITVRFGNVLGSAGSVVPLFEKQLAAGGPLTVTHPDIERYFMITAEAVELVLQAAALGPGRNDQGAIYVLDMGAPVKIMDLARQVVRLAGKIPDEDIRIEITGLRPGEKLYEELFHGLEPPVGTDMDGILIARPRASALNAISARLDHLADACRRQDTAVALGVLNELVPELSRPAAPESQPKPGHLKVIK
jgi:FlaA1/EpsC-like NDP-sugar epimerase